MADIGGTCAEELLPLRDAFEHNRDSGADIGASVAVFIDGEPVVDLWGGHWDATRPGQGVVDATRPAGCRAT